MMRRTAACAGALLALYLSAWLPLGSKPLEVSQPFSFDGIAEVVLQGNVDSVTFTARPPAAFYNPSEIPKLMERRKGQVLVIYPENGSRHAFDILLPPTVTRLHVEGTMVMAEEGVGMRQLEVRFHDHLDWSGGIPRLDLVDTRTRTEGDCEHCGNRIAIGGDHIGELRVSTGFGHVDVQHPDNVGSAVLFLGPDARFSLGMAKRKGDVRIAPWQPGILGKPQEDADTP